MNIFVDEYPRQLDDKGRFIMPAKLRDKLTDTVFITRSPSEECLHLYTSDEWEVIAQKLRNLPTSTNKNAAAFVRIFFGKATECEMDKQGRISVSKKFIDYAHLKKDIVLVGANTRLEIWDSEEWDNYQNSQSSDVVLEGIEQFNIGI